MGIYIKSGTQVVTQLPCSAVSVVRTVCLPQQQLLKGTSAQNYLTIKLTRYFSCEHHSAKA